MKTKEQKSNIDQPVVRRSIADIEKRLNTAKEGLEYWQKEQILSREESYSRMCYTQVDTFRGEINILNWVLGEEC